MQSNTDALGTNKERDLKLINANQMAGAVLDVSIIGYDSFTSPSTLCVLEEAGYQKVEYRIKCNFLFALPSFSSKK